MKTFVYLLILVPQVLFAQALEGTGHGLRAGDKLSRNVISVDCGATAGRNVVWDLQEMEILDDEYTTCYWGAEAAPWLVAGCEGLLSHQYLTTEEGIDILGRYSPTAQMTYDIPERLVRFPMLYGDSIMGIYGGTGSYGDKLFVREYGNYVTRMDATGCLVLPDGDTLRHVSRLTTERQVFLETALADSMRMVYGDSVPVYNADSIYYHILTGAPLQRVREQRWYAAGYRYPILESVECRAFSHDGIVSQAMLYYSPSVQETQLEYDEENMFIRRLIAHGEYQPSDGGGTSGGSKEENTTPILEYQLIQNHESATLTIEYSLNGAATVRAVLASVMGVVYQTVEQSNGTGTDYSLSLSYGSLPHGQYVVYISADGGIYAEKIQI